MANDNGKPKSLREHNALNPHPERVRDKLFASDPFFDARDLVQVRYEMLRRVSKEGWSISDSARNFGVTRPTWYRVDSAFREDGLAGLVPERRGPRRAHKLDETVVAAILEARKATPRITTGDLVELVRSRFGVTVHRRSVERALNRVQKKT